MKYILTLLITLFSITCFSQVGLGKKESDLRKELKISDTKKTEILPQSGYRSLMIDSSGLYIQFIFDKKNVCFAINVTPQSYYICELFYEIILDNYTRLEDGTFMKIGDEFIIMMKMSLDPKINEHMYFFTIKPLTDL